MAVFYDDDKLSIRSTLKADKSRLRTLFSVTEMPEENIYMIEAMRGAGSTLLEPLAINKSRQVIAYMMFTRAVATGTGENLLISLMSARCFHQKECTRDIKKMFFESAFDQLAAMGEDMVLALGMTEELSDHGFERELGEQVELDEGENDAQHPFIARPLSLAGKNATPFKVSIAHPFSQVQNGR